MLRNETHELVPSLGHDDAVEGRMTIGRTIAPSTPSLRGDDEGVGGVDGSSLVGPDGSHTPLLNWFSSQITDLSWKYLQKNHATERTKVMQLKSPQQIRSEVDLSIHDQPSDLNQLIFYCKKALELGVCNNHARFFNQLYGSTNPVGLLGEWISTVCNTNIHTYEAAPFFILVEKEVLAEMTKTIGFPEGDGIFSPGGSISNLYGLLLARHKAAPHILKEGYHGDEALVLFTSSQSHYSIKKNASLIGLGKNSCILIECDELGRMKPSLLREAVIESISRAQKPFFVNATCGTTVLGAFDPLEEISSICKEFGMWLHIDGALGGSVLLSREHRENMKGCSKADSMTWNPHKCMGIPLQCSAFLVARKGLLQECFASNANYLFQPDKLFAEYDVGEKSIQCGRKTDAFKLWLTWKSKGKNGFEDFINKLYDSASYLRSTIASKSPRFLLVSNDPTTLNVCFWFVPSRLLSISSSSATNEKANERAFLDINTKGGQLLHRVTARIKSTMQERGNVLVAYQPLGEKPNFFKICINSVYCTRRDLDFVLEEIEIIGNQIMASTL